MKASSPKEDKETPPAVAEGDAEEKESSIFGAVVESERSPDSFFVMSATVISVADSVAAVTAEVEFAACDCCGLTEECTPAYIARVRERHGGRWICGLCAEAVKDEICRSGLLLSPEEAVGRHASFCRSFRTSASSEPSVDPAERLIAAVRQLFRRSLDSPRAVRSTPSSPRSNGEAGSRAALGRTGSGFPTLLG
ncbi:unnamed protein product [Musa hybrid cultivar]